MVGHVEMVVMVVIHQELGHTGLKPVLSQDLCMDQITDVKIISFHHVVSTVTQLLLILHLVQINAELDITLHIPQI